MECYKCHLIYKEEDTKKFTCGHIICKTCFYNVVIKDLINNINNNTKTYLINCKCNKGTLIFELEDLKNIKLPSDTKEINSCKDHDNEVFIYYDKTNKKLLCSKCNLNPEYKDHEKIAIEDLKLNIKEKISKLEFNSYDIFQKYIKDFFEKFTENSKKYYQEEISKMDSLINKISQMKKDIEIQMNEQIEKEKMLFNLIDVIYRNNYENLKLFNNESSTGTKLGYRFCKLLSKVKFDFGEFGIEHQEEIIPEFDKLIKEFEDNVSQKKYKISIKYPYFELIKSFTKINDYKQSSIISCVAANKNTNELSVGYRDYTINVFRLQGSNYELFQTIKGHRGEISSLLYLDNYLISGSKDKTLKVWEPNSDNSYILRQKIKNSEREIKKLNGYVNESQIGFLVTGDESSFRLFLKKSEEKLEENGKEEDLNSMEVEEPEKKETEKEKEKEDENADDNKNLKEIFEIKQVLNDHDNEVNEAIQIKSNNDIISGSKDMTVVVWKDHMNCLIYESDQIISAGNEVHAICAFGNKGFAFAVNGSYEIIIYELNSEVGEYVKVCVLPEDYCHSKTINQLILLKDNRLGSCSYDGCVKIISFNPLTKELREDQELDDQTLSVNSIVETSNGKLISGGHDKHIIVYKRS